ncbi:hypothetical protein JZ751_011677 [Albula glossodonta]|uniref:Uncharacterized protein n=1 Tax=Albula glossodonta TaxID=121402 RepID=A0A8T2PQE8_9TELE|nr:hypothetical protein JZ751_011677 [Albula glossodonta]
MYDFNVNFLYCCCSWEVFIGGKRTPHQRPHCAILVQITNHCAEGIGWSGITGNGLSQSEVSQIQ